VVSLVKQWLAQMRQGSSAAEHNFQRVKRLTELDQLLDSLVVSEQHAEPA